MDRKNLMPEFSAFGRRSPDVSDRSRTTRSRHKHPIKHLFAALLCCLAGASLAHAQPPLKGFTTFLPAKRIVTPPAALRAFSSVITPLPQWRFTVTADPSLGGGTFSGTIMGRSPYFRGKTTTTIPTQIVPLIITINGITYDPTQPDACLSGSPTDVNYVEASPVFQNSNWTMNGVFTGHTQYIDAFQRAEFWSLVAGTPYHLVLNTSTLPAQSLTFSGQNFSGGCGGGIGTVDINTLDAAIQSLILGPLAGTVNAGTFPIFLTKNVFATLNGQCCVLGYHSGLYVGTNFQVYSEDGLDTTGLIGGDVSSMAHEIGEAVNDPMTNNPTPSWGNIGQTVGTCQSNLEVGDPLSPGFGTPTNEFVVNGYHLQELAFFSWFFGGPALGAGGGYSDNGSFTGFAKLCPPGGTN